ncbi:MAG: ABC-F family ATP-binding cassette domain-containing protein, partial [Clostridia bacterium]|nr:ABC-F family ATP-binding cassette domain-containing protein [Clostridia bacterium]
IMSEVWDDFPHMEPDRVRSTLALFLLTGEDVFRTISTLSGGERGRVALAKLMLKKDNLLILDEPTNHLDMDSREVLEGALDDFDGTILTVSHDRYFINRVATRVIEMNEDGVTEYVGNYDDYLDTKKRIQLGEVLIDTQGKTKTQIEKDKKKEKLLRESEKTRKAKFQKLEKDISDTEDRLSEIEIEMGKSETWLDRGKAAALEEERARKTEELEKMYEDWEALAEIME